MQPLSIQSQQIQNNNHNSVISNVFNLKLKLSDVKIRYYGKNKDGSNQDLQLALKEWQQFADLYDNPVSYYYRIWVTTILKGAAKRVQTNDKNHNNDIFELWGVLADRFPTASKLESRIHALSTFQYKPYNSNRTHLTLFRDLIVKIDDDIQTNVILNHHGRLPNYIPDENAIYDYLLFSIWNLPNMHDKVRTWELERKPEIFDAAYVRNKQDFEKLEENMIKAEKLVFPNGILQKRDCRDRTRNHNDGKPLNYHYFAPYGRVTPRRLRWQRNENRRARIRYAQFGRFRQFVQNAGCHACGRSNHKIKDCRDETKRDS